jgi:hypothetical protein
MDRIAFDDDTGARRCQCGAYVGGRWTRVFGAEGRLPACKACYVNPHGTAYETTYHAIQAYRRGAGAFVGGEDD